MELKQLISHFTYRIEPKPGGGFIAHPSDPSVAPLEAPTREELQKKIQENIRVALSAQFPGLKLPAENQNVQFSFHIEHKPGGGYAIHSSDPNAGRRQATEMFAVITKVFSTTADSQLRTRFFTPSAPAHRGRG